MGFLELVLFEKIKRFLLYFDFLWVYIVVNLFKVVIFNDVIVGIVLKMDYVVSCICRGNNKNFIVNKCFNFLLVF